MSYALILRAVIAGLFSLMAFRAFRSGSVVDYLLCAAQGIGVLLLFSAHQELACYLLLITACAYLLSQVLTGARLISRLLPIAGAATIGLLLLG